MAFAFALFPSFQRPVFRLSVNSKHGYFLYKFRGPHDGGLPGIVVEMLRLMRMRAAGRGSVEGIR